MELLVLLIKLIIKGLQNADQGSRQQQQQWTWEQQQAWEQQQRVLQAQREQWERERQQLRQGERGSTAFSSDATRSKRNRRKPSSPPPPIPAGEARPTAKVGRADAPALSEWMRPRTLR